MSPAGDGVWPREHGIEHTPTKHLDSYRVRDRLGVVESCMHLATGLLGGDERVHGPMRSLDCSQQGDLSSAPLFARESTDDLIAAVVGDRMSGRGTEGGRSWHPREQQCSGCR